MAQSRATPSTSSTPLSAFELEVALLPRVERGAVVDADEEVMALS